MTRFAIFFCVLGACSSGESVIDGSVMDASASIDLHASDLAQGDASPASDAAVARDYAMAGPYAVASSMATITNGSRTFTVTITQPTGATSAPVVVLASGFVQPAAAYAPYAVRLASFGIVTITRDDPSTEQITDLVADLVYVVGTWLPAANADATSVLHGVVDASRVGLAGHSRGGQAVLLAAESAKGKIAGVFTIDPVDSNSLARTSLSSIGVPLVLLGETTDATGGMFGMPCAPAADNFQTLYGFAASPTVEINVLGADHTQFEDPSSCSFCTLCTAGTASASSVLATAVKYTTAFFARTLLGDATVGTAFEGAGATADESAGTITLTSK